MDWRQRARNLKTDIPALLLSLKNKDTPIVAKLLVMIIVFYALSPIDLIPDFIPLLGYLDDVIILPALITVTIRLIPKDVFAQCRTEAEGIWNNGKPKKWYYAIPVVLIWLIIVWLIVRTIFF